MPCDANAIFPSLLPLTLYLVLFFPSSHHHGLVTGLALTADGKKMFSSSASGSLAVYDSTLITYPCLKLLGKMLVQCGPYMYVHKSACGCWSLFFSYTQSSNTSFSSDKLHKSGKCENLPNKSVKRRHFDKFNQPPSIYCVTIGCVYTCISALALMQHVRDFYFVNTVSFENSFSHIL